MALDVNRLKNLDNEIGGDSTLVFANKIDGDMDVRILPPTERMKGLYFVERKVWWINGKPYLSNATFGLDDIVQITIDEAKALKDRDLTALCNDDQKLAMKPDYLIPLLKLNCTFDAQGSIESFKVDGEKGKLFCCGTMMLKAINKQVLSRNTQPDITDRVKGFNMLLQKEGAGLKTVYSAEAWRERTEMDQKYYNDYIDPVEWLESEKLSDAYLEGVIRNYLYGERMPDESTKKEAPKPSVAAPQRKTGGSESAPSVRGGRTAEVTTGRRGATVDTQEAVEDQAPAEEAKAAEEQPAATRSSTRSAAPTEATGGGKRRNLLADIGED